jgi:enhancing lycopene biosynthesis protein 2
MSRWSRAVRGMLGAGALLVAAGAQAWGNPHAVQRPPRVGVLIYGAGKMDGSEVQEVVLTLLALDRAGAQIVPIAPAGNQAEVVNHQTGAADGGEQRNMLVEAARITHGGVVPLDSVEPEDLDALVIPGGLGFAKSVTTFGKDGAAFSYDPALGLLLAELHRQRKPLGFLCITPILAAKLFGAEQPRLTIGSDAGMMALIEGMGARAVPATAEEVVVDEGARIVSSPAYMVGPSVSHVAVGIATAVERVLGLVRSPHHR